MEFSTTRVEKLGFSEKTINDLKQVGIKTVGDIEKIVSLLNRHEVKDKLHSYGITA